MGTTSSALLLDEMIAEILVLTQGCTHDCLVDDGALLIGCTGSGMLASSTSPMIAQMRCRAVGLERFGTGAC